MRFQHIILFLLSALLVGCHYDNFIIIHNNSEQDVYMFMPDFNYTPKQKCDTSIYFLIKDLRLIPPGGHLILSEYVPAKYKDVANVYLNRFPSDTVSLFLFDPEVVDNNGWNQIRENYMVLKRYDLTAKDLRSKKILNALWPPKAEAAYVRQYPQ